MRHTFIYLFMLTSDAFITSTQIPYCTFQLANITVFSDQISAKGCEARKPVIINVIKLPAKLSESRTQKDLGDVLTPLILIDKPLHEQPVRSNDGSLLVQVQIKNVQLTEHHLIELHIDGQVVMTQSGLTFQISNLDRGAHDLSARILHQGKVIALSDSIRVYLLRASR